MIQPDSNHDEQVDNGDVNERPPLNGTFKIHPGWRNNTRSGGCQTVHRDDHDAFARAARVDGQSTWRYVLAEVAP